VNHKRVYAGNDKRPDIRSLLILVILSHHDFRKKENNKGHIMTVALVVAILREVKMPFVSASDQF
jgi:hypothetical protein